MQGYSRMSKYIDSQVRYWTDRKATVEIPKEESLLPFVTISREYGCGGFDVARKISELLNEKHSPKPPWAAYDRKLIEQVMEDMGLSQKLTETLTQSARKSLTNLIETSFSNFPPQVAVFRRLVETIQLLARNGHVIIVGRAGNVITKNLKNGLHVRITADMNFKIERIASIMGISKGEAEKVILEKGDERDSFLKKYVKYNVDDPHEYHLLVNNSHYTTDEAAELIISALRIKGMI